MLSKKNVYVLIIILKSKIIHGHTYRNKTKKPCWWQLPISKSLLPQGRIDNKMKMTIKFCIFELL